jgi:hypothetical protein
MDALGRITRLCDDAAAFVAEPVAGMPLVSLPVAKLVERVNEVCAARCSPLDFTAAPDTVTGTVRATHLDSVVHSLAVILCAVKRSTTNHSVRVSVKVEEKEARFLLGCDDDRAALAARSPEIFDPWRGGHGIALPLACRIVAEAGGRIWTYANARGAVGIALPEEAS